MGVQDNISCRMKISRRKLETDASLGCIPTSIQR